MAAQGRQTKPQTDTSAIVTLLALARRAGAIETGLDAALRACRKGAARLLVVSSELGRSARGKTEQVSAEYGIELIEIETGLQELGQALGLRDIGVVAVCDVNFARGIRKKAPAASRH